jgi:hypothetical protein
MILTERIEDINNLLIEHFGISTDTGEAIWRVVFSEDQFEKRYGTYDDYTKGGLYIRTVTEVREVPKYKQWIQQKYILERLVAVPEQNLEELLAIKLSYEVIWVFEDGNGNYLPPKFEACKFIIDTVYAAQYSNHNLRKYIDDESTQEKSEELKSKRVDEIMEALWGDQSQFRDGIRSKETVMLGGADFQAESVKLESKIFLTKKNSN